MPFAGLSAGTFFFSFAGLGVLQLAAIVARVSASDRHCDCPGPGRGRRRRRRLLSGIISSILVLPSQSPPGPAGGALDGYGLGRAAGPRGATLAARARAELHWPRGTRRSHICRTGLLRVASQDVTIHMSAHAPPQEPIRDRIDWQSGCATVWVGTYASRVWNHFQHF